MDLSPEDSLRLNVLFSQQLRAVRIDDSRLMLHALTSRGEAKVPLNPTGRDERYLRAVRELLAMHALGVPAGYPVHLHRWTRSAQGRSEDSLRRLLLLGEPEAVVAVAGAPGLSDELAELAWWASATADNARRMLASPAVAQGRMGPVLARFVFEFLPFEEDHRAIADSVTLILARGLLGETERMALWARGRNKVAYLLGFLRRTDDLLPAGRPDHALHAALAPALDGLRQAANPYGRALSAALGADGQARLHAVRQALARVSGKDVAAGLAGATGAWLRTRAEMVALPDPSPWRVADDGAGLDAALEGELAQAPVATAWHAAEAALPGERARLLAVAALLRLGEDSVVARLGSAEPVGSALRARLAPLLRMLETTLDRLLT